MYSAAPADWTRSGGFQFFLSCPRVSFPNSADCSKVPEYDWFYCSWCQSYSGPMELSTRTWKRDPMYWGLEEESKPSRPQHSHVLKCVKSSVKVKVFVQLSAFTLWFTTTAKFTMLHFFFLLIKTMYGFLAWIEWSASISIISENYHDYYFTNYEIFLSVLTIDPSPEFEWEKISSGLQTSSEYSSWS